MNKVQILELLHSKEIVARILEDLNAVDPTLKGVIRDLKGGCIAGGSVGNLISSYIWPDFKPIINDIDIFVNQALLNEYTRAYKGRLTETISDVDSFKISVYDKDNYLRQNVLSPTYQINNVYKSSKLNVINVNSPEYLNLLKINSSCAESTALEIIREFDFNNVQVAVDLKTNKIVYTNEFLKFLLSRQLCICNYYQITATFFRLLQKSEQLNLYCNIQAEVNKLSTALLAYIRYIQDVHLSFTITDSMIKKHFKQLHLVEKYFHITPVIYGDKGKQSKTINLIYPKDSKRLNVDEMFKWIDKKIAKIAVSDSKIPSLLRLMKTYNDVVRGYGINEYRKDYVLTLNEYLGILASYNSGFIDEYISKDKLNVIIKAFKDHDLYNAYNLSNMPLSKIYELVVVFNGYESKYGHFAWGLITTDNAFISKIEGALSKNSFEFDLDDMMEAHIKARSEVLNKPIPHIEGMQYHKELLTGLDLDTEGTQMHHCVGGYSGAIKINRSRIFSIKTPEGRSTLEVQMNGGWETKDRVSYILELNNVYFIDGAAEYPRPSCWIINQNRANLNLVPSQANLDYADQLVGKLNSMELYLYNLAKSSKVETALVA